MGNDGLHDMRAQEVETVLTVKPHKLMLEYIQKEGTSGITLKYKGADTNFDLTGIPETRLLPRLGDKEQAANANAGLQEEIFYFTPEASLVDSEGVTLNDFDHWPSIIRIAKTINYTDKVKPWPGLKRSKDFAMSWSGFLTIKRSGIYSFSITSAISRLYVDGALVVSSGKKRDVQGREGSKTLAEGPHRVWLQCLQSTDHTGMIFKYSGPDTVNTMVVVPTEALQLQVRGAAQAAVIRRSSMGLKESIYYFPQQYQVQDLGGRKVYVGHTGFQHHVKHYGHLASEPPASRGYNTQDGPWA